MANNVSMAMKGENIVCNNIIMYVCNGVVIMKKKKAMKNNDQSENQHLMCNFINGGNNGK